jgi:hypothetical protein
MCLQNNSTDLLLYVFAWWQFIYSASDRKTKFPNNKMIVVDESEPVGGKW